MTRSPGSTFPNSLRLLVSASFICLSMVPACVDSDGDTIDPDDRVPSGDGDAPTSGGGTSPALGSGGSPPLGTGGSATGGGVGTASGGVGTGGGGLGTGGADSPPTPVDCSGIVSAGYELCDSTADTCGAVFTDASGCSVVCAAAGLECLTAYENADSVCGADTALPAIACDSGHQSDYCACMRPDDSGGSGGAGSGGAGTGGAGTGGAPGTGGADPGDESDCNLRSDLPSVDVNKDGSGDFTTMQGAIDSLPSSNNALTVLRVAPGEYYEKLTIDVPNIILCGQVGQEANTVLTYSHGSDSSNGNGGTVGTSGSASVNLSASDVSVENITFENTRGVGAQAVALLVSGSRVQFKNSRFLGHQDTVYVKEGSQYFKDCHIEGTVDFIFGGATAVFDECTIHNVGGGTAITAASTEEATPFGIVFLGGQLTAAGGVGSGSVHLGRNWRPYGATTYIRTEMGSHIAAVGWTKMGDNSLSTARYSEYQSSGPGANPNARASESEQLSAGEAGTFNVDDIFGAWDPSYAD